MAFLASKAAIADAAKKVDAAAAVLEMAITDSDMISARRSLRLEAMKLVESLSDPNEDVWPRIYQVNVSAAIEIVTNLGLWGDFADGATVTLADIVRKSNADETMIGRPRVFITAIYAPDLPTA